MSAHATYKRNVARSFNRATLTYDEVANLQKKIGLELLQFCEFFSKQVTQLVDIGAGTGALTSLIESQFVNARCYFIDIAETMLNLAYSRQSQLTSASICADFDNLPFKSQAFDFVYSNMCLQWSLDLNKTKNELLRCLQPGGIMALAFLSEGTLSEFKNKCSDFKKPSRVNPLYSVGDIREIFSLGQSQIIDLQQRNYVEHYNSAAELIAFLKKTGANYSVCDQSKTTYQKSEYQNQLRATDPFASTFSVTYILARKR